jgi:hypothetical protein
MPSNLKPALLNFEHIVQVNDPGDSRLPSISRQQLWQGLVMRARNPDKFIRGLQCESQPPDNNEFLRRTQAGDSNFCEKVILDPEHEIRTRTLPDHDQIKAESTTRIEEPEPGYLFVRFSYQRELEVTTEAVDVAEHLKSAYVQVDRDAIAMIRMLAESRLFDGLIN